MTCIQIPGGIVCVQPTFKAGDTAPTGAKRQRIGKCADVL